MIVVEGGDNVGKSTLVAQLIEESSKRLYVMKRQRFSPSLGGSIGQSYLDMLVPGSQGERPIVQGVADRLLASEVVYGSLFRGGSRLTSREHFLIRASLISLGAFVVFCDPPDDAIRATWAEREQLYPHDPLTIARAYRERIAGIFAPVRVVRYDWTSPHASRDRASILELHRRVVQSFESLASLDPHFHAHKVST